MNDVDRAKLEANNSDLGTQALLVAAIASTSLSHIIKIARLVR